MDLFLGEDIANIKLPHSPVKKIELNSTLAGCKDEICCMG
jgi:hypothetical protein